MIPSISSAVRAAAEAVRARIPVGTEATIEEVCEIVLREGFDHVRGIHVSHVVKIAPGNVTETTATAIGGPKEVIQAQSRMMGFTGDCCTACGNFAMVQNGTCKKCTVCGETTGCS